MISRHAGGCGHADQHPLCTTVTQDGLCFWDIQARVVNFPENFPEISENFGKY